MFRLGHAHSGQDLRSGIRHASLTARRLVDAAMASCKPCRWDGTLAVSGDLTPGGTVAEVYRAAVEGTVLRMLADGTRLPADRFVLADVAWAGLVVGHWPFTEETWARCGVMVVGGSVTVDVAGVLSYMEELDLEDRARVVDDCLDMIRGAEFYPPARIDRYLATV